MITLTFEYNAGIIPEFILFHQLSIPCQLNTLNYSRET